MSSTTDGLKRKSEPGTSSASEHETPPAKITRSVLNILDIPTEILIEIILFLNVRERVGLGNSCKRFNSLVFEDEKLLKNLDFSKDGCLTLASDIQQYFENENSCNKILRVNVKDTHCMKPGRMLNDSIGKAKKLVDINVHGLEFKDILQLGSFLNPLRHMERLSFDWSEANGNDIPIHREVLQRPFSKLKYLSVKMKGIDSVEVFIPSLRLCEELEELCVVVNKTSSQTSYSDNWSANTKTLNNLKVVEYCGPQANQMKVILFKTLLQNPEKWADFKLGSSSDPKGFHLAFVDDNEELVDGTLWSRKIRNAYSENRSDSAWALYPELLLQESLKITHENVPELCCLSTFRAGKRCLLKIDDAKRLLENPRSQITYLYMNHPVGFGCDVHLLASAFLNLTELHLAAVTKNPRIFPKKSHFQRRLKKQGQVVPEELQDEGLNMDSSFQMLVENTPQLKHFTLGGAFSYENWDLDELHLIKRWKHLKSLRLIRVPIVDGEFLIEIGKRCENLENLELKYIGARENCCYEKELLQMVTNCRKLRDFTLVTTYFHVTHQLLPLLAKNVHLSRVRVQTTYRPTFIPYHQQCLASSIEQFLHQCSELKTFSGFFECTEKWGLTDLQKMHQRWIKELKRPHLQIKMRWGPTTAGTISENKPHSNPFPRMRITN